ncbi:J-type co-chaperone JAC1 like protein [Verticillium longisporum]|uniref:J-type co-chaperone JAC1 like protein n=1 Tax=Verticillium longisporum TaxID=100787 RepID=A0A8I3AUR3_VERLO|nr:J-type co-chaperone JAC1 like protein [Verticillium longisporum]KAG7138663.1 J-type co-chaperone JAC1 like protein [Verticillium longisporum]
MRTHITSTARLCARCRRQTASSPLAPACRSISSTSLSSTSLSSTSLAVQRQTLSPQARWLSRTATLTKPDSPSTSSSSASSSATAADASPSQSKIPTTHYDFFPQTLPSGPPPAGHFPIGQRTLRREFLQLQAKAHPDLHPAAHKARAEATSARINEAYKTLSNPLLRAQYLLALRGADVANDETLKVDGDPGLLLTVLEAREEIEDAATEAELEGLRAVNDARIRASEDVLEAAFHGDDLEAAKREAVRLRYWVNIRDSLDAWESGKPVVLEH